MVLFADKITNYCDENDKLQISLMHAPRSHQNLHHSPTAATLGHQSSAILDTVPPLISINDRSDPKPVIGSSHPYYQVKKKVPNARGTQVKQKNNKIELYSKWRQQKTNSTRKQASFTSPMAKHNHVVNGREDALHQVETFPRDEDSMAESVYLDLEEYSSIHKFESISPYNEEFQEDQEYAQYFNASRKHPNGWAVSSRIGHKLEGEENWNHLGLRKKQSPSLDLNDTYAQFLVEQGQNVNSIKVRRTLSANDQNEELNSHLLRHASLEIKNGKPNMKFEQIEQEAIEASQANHPKSINQITDQIYGAFYGLQQLMPSLASPRAFDRIASFNQYIQSIQPDWLASCNSTTSLRMILTKPKKLEEFSKYLRQLQLLLIQKAHLMNIQSIQNRYDTAENENITHTNNKAIVHFEKIEPETQPIIHQQTIRVSAIGFKVDEPIRKGPLSEVGKFSQFSKISKFSYPLSLRQVQKQSGFHNSLKKSRLATLRENNSDVERDSSAQMKEAKKNIRRRENIRYSQQQILGVLQALVSKLSSKKCKILIGQSQSESTVENKSDMHSFWATQQVKQPQKLQNKQGLNLAKASRSRIPLIEMQFDEVQANDGTGQSASAKLEFNRLRKKQLEQILDMKEKQIEQIKAEYDYIINNYVATIANLKNVKQKDPEPANHTMADEIEEKKRKDKQRLNEEYQNYRLSQPITFQMSKHDNQSYEDIDQWIGNPLPEPYENKQLAYLRRSLPEKN